MREDQKTEKALKELLRLPANKRCINCDSLGPQYVVSAFNVFVCTVCSGVHRQFGHRVKGVSMSTFKKDEVETLRETGNEKFAAFFLNKWTSEALPKPVEREAPHISAWISAVYQDRRFYGEPAGEWAAGAAPAPSAAGSTSANEVPEPAMRPLHEVLGSDTPKLQVQHSGSMTSGTRGPERTVSGASSVAGGATPTRSATVPAPSGASGSAAPAARKPLNLLDASSPTSATSASPGGAARLVGAWDPFGPASPKQPPAAAARSQGSPRPSSAPAAEAGWASFGDTPAPAPPAPQQPAAAPAAEGAAGSGWEAFGDGPAAGPAAPPAAAAAAAAGGARAAEPSPPPGKSPQPQAVRSSSRPEVPMDIFFPEFEKIRATGLLPNGQPVPLPAFSHSSHAHASRAPQYQQQQQQYHQQQQQQHHAVSNPYAAAAHTGAPSRPTISIPQAPLQPGGYYAAGGPSPAGYPGMPSPNPYPSPSSGYSPAGSGASSGYSPAVQPFANGGGASSGGAGGGGPFADLRGSTGSLGELMPGGSAAPTPAGHRLGDPAAAYDPFAGLAPGLRAALPHGGSNGKRGSAPPPTPAAVPPFANGGAAQLPAYLSGGPFGGPAAPSPVGLAPATAAASATLYGRAPSLTGYDLSAPSAPKPQASGNPFA